MKKGFATPQGTAAFRDRFKGRLDPGHFREKNKLFFSSIGIGSYLGDNDDKTDALYEEALKEAVLSGINAIDSAINYRCQRSERSFGRALAELFSAGKISREEVIISTKGGFIPFDGDYPDDPREYFKKNFIDNGLLKLGDVAQGCHAMTPEYLENQLDASLSNLGLETIDIYYLHNPETQLSEVEPKIFKEKMKVAFQWMEEKVKQGKIRMYGTATWNGFRADPRQSEYLSLEELALLGREIGGPDHHFKVVQLPFNLAMPEAWVFANQNYGGHRISFFSAAERLDICVAGSASLLQARLAGELPAFIREQFPNFKKSSQCSLQFARSVPGMTTSLVGMKTTAHVQENLEVAKVPALTANELVMMFQKHADQ